MNIFKYSFILLPFIFSTLNAGIDQTVLSTTRDGGTVDPSVATTDGIGYFIVGPNGSAIIDTIQFNKYMSDYIEQSKTIPYIDFSDYIKKNVPLNLQQAMLDQIANNSVINPNTNLEDNYYYTYKFKDLADKTCYVKTHNKVTDNELYLMNQDVGLSSRMKKVMRDKSIAAIMGGDAMKAYLSRFDLPFYSTDKSAIDYTIYNMLEQLKNSEDPEDNLMYINLMNFKTLSPEITTLLSDTVKSSKSISGSLQKMVSDDFISSPVANSLSLINDIVTFAQAYNNKDLLLAYVSGDMETIFSKYNDNMLSLTEKANKYNDIINMYNDKESPVLKAISDDLKNGIIPLSLFADQTNFKKLLVQKLSSSGVPVLLQDKISYDLSNLISEKFVGADESTAKTNIISFLGSDEYFASAKKALNTINDSIKNINTSKSIYDKLHNFTINTKHLDLLSECLVPPTLTVSNYKLFGHSSGSSSVYLNVNEFDGLHSEPFNIEANGYSIGHYTKCFDVKAYAKSSTNFSETIEKKFLYDDEKSEFSEYNGDCSVNCIGDNIKNYDYIISDDNTITIDVPKKDTGLPEIKYYDVTKNIWVVDPFYKLDQKIFNVSTTRYIFKTTFSIGNNKYKIFMKYPICSSYNGSYEFNLHFTDLSIKTIPTAYGSNLLSYNSNILYTMDYITYNSYVPNNYGYIPYYKYTFGSNNTISKTINNNSVLINNIGDGNKINITYIYKSNQSDLFYFVFGYGTNTTSKYVKTCNIITQECIGDKINFADFVLSDNYKNISSTKKINICNDNNINEYCSYDFKKSDNDKLLENKINNQLVYYGYNFSKFENGQYYHYFLQVSTNNYGLPSYKYGSNLKVFNGNGDYVKQLPLNDTKNFNGLKYFSIDPYGYMEYILIDIDAGWEVGDKGYYIVNNLSNITYNSYVHNVDKKFVTNVPFLKYSSYNGADIEDCYGEKYIVLGSELYKYMNGQIFNIYKMYLPSNPNMNNNIYNPAIFKDNGECFLTYGATDNGSNSSNYFVKIR